MRSSVVVRLLLLVAIATIASLLFLTKCGIGPDENQNNGHHIIRELRSLSDEKQPQPYVMSSISVFLQRELEYKQQIKKLNLEIQYLRQHIDQLKTNTKMIENPTTAMSTRSIPGNTTFSTLNILRSSTKNMNSMSSSYDCSSYIRKQVGNAEILHGLPLNNEYELIPFNHFTFARMYPIEIGLGKRVVEKPIGYKRKDLLNALSKALESINKYLSNKANKKSANFHNESAKLTMDDFIEGVFRTEPTTGTQYELYFRNKRMTKFNSMSSKSNKINSTNSSIIKVLLMRPFAPMQTVQVTPMLTTYSKDISINIILPLSGRTSTFKSFMENFMKLIINNEQHLHLTVVYFGEKGLKDVRIIMSRAIKASNGLYSSRMKLLALNETFSRAKGIRVGVERVGNNETKEDALLFMCDVDVVFNAKFLDRCKWNAEPGKKVYYPVVFSLYNPHVVYTLQGKKIPSEAEQMQITRDTGFWRDFGYGMTCQYKSDFVDIRGFDEEIVGWGGEDVMLFRKYVRSKIKIVRATDPGIFHIWHQKTCNGVNGQHLTADQYRACIRSRALNEASHAQLGFLAFRDDIAAHNKNSSAT
ncbi:chondroitin sulfate N-acetylgalactosaminyltransferase 2 [Teleopsis dalmanni]|uniref:chondroitin sulfate N-acetylgalactosaminyltransferase 2 n=1 Tax=Teleopsis dalmanni TaxID=139649 RepID=UPI0018CCF78B|nr:chondroitin sulfate N-acetylgalactosaminyltransferase 2 [Teleopsis dalmanni]